jgi:hypothetical protein
MFSASLTYADACELNTSFLAPCGSPQNSNPFCFAHPGLIAAPVVKA